ncbi:Hypothetical protein D9617_1g087370 [Elsinoe fawcettii]|nr:Hypothetical protein D9617_1g087370 [Elsinoe fawcettii]
MVVEIKVAEILLESLLVGVRPIEDIVSEVVLRSKEELFMVCVDVTSWSEVVNDDEDCAIVEITLVVVGCVVVGDDAKLELSAEDSVEADETTEVLEIGTVELSAEVVLEISLVRGTEVVDVAEVLV